MIAPKKRYFPGLGILRGMAVTARNWIGSYFKPERLVTVQYPEEQLPLPENSRTIPFLIYDGDDPDAGLRCVACLACAKECPPNAISIVMDRDENGRPAKRPKIFDLDVTACMGCQICVEVCPFDAIAMDSAFDQSSFDRFDSLILDKRALAKPNSYYHQIKPTDASAADERIEAERRRKEEARQKRAASDAKND